MNVMTSVLRRELAAQGTVSFYFQKPEGFVFKAGQYVDMTVRDLEEAGSRGSAKSLSIASAPYEPELMITTRIRGSAFKGALQKETGNIEIKIIGPFGSFVLQNNSERPAVFLMGGIGVTPARSMILQATADKSPQKIFLFYSNRRPEDTPFLNDFKKAAKNNPNFTFIPVMTQMEDSKEVWVGERGYINSTMLGKYIPDLQSPIYYTAGSMKMTNGMREMLNRIGIDDDDIQSEEFPAY